MANRRYNWNNKIAWLERVASTKPSYEYYLKRLSHYNRMMEKTDAEISAMNSRFSSRRGRLAPLKKVSISKIKF